MKKHSEKEIKDAQYWLTNVLFGKPSIFGIVFRNMKANRLDPFGKDTEELFKRIEILRNRINKNPRIAKLYMDVFNSQEE